MPNHNQWQSLLRKLVAARMPPLTQFCDLFTIKCDLFTIKNVGNKTLRNAGKAKNDEFYTQLADIERECSHYKEHFKGKTIFCNCDDPYESEFFKYFAMNFNHLGLKKLLASCYSGSPIANTQLSLFDFESEENKTTRHPHKIEITEMANGNGSACAELADMRGLPLVEYVLRNKKNALTRLDGDGDFRSPECVEMLKEADIVVTNPPFSLFREYVAQLMEFDKKFLIVGSLNAITYKEIFTLIKENELWLGYGFLGGNAFFKTTVNREFADGVYNSETGLVKFRNVHWFTNLDIKKRHEKMTFWRSYTPQKFPKYDNYDAIEVSKLQDIPEHYDDAMGVPITFLDKYNPEQFEIIKFRKGDDDKDLSISGKYTYFRILIKRKQ
ncbi:MAG: hypothetical protein Ta2A_08280 [Treponemataceae bacterium]|nr:MAG: hypothetical protein Ta2A_08280 [Treponemataceae bacterium]